MIGCNDATLLVLRIWASIDAAISRKRRLLSGAFAIWRLDL
jgi:hypothetical protein